MEIVDSKQQIQSDSQPAWRSRGYIPHFDQPGLFQMITFRLYDSMPAGHISRMRRENPNTTPVQWRSRMEGLLDSGIGACYLDKPEVAQLAQETLLHFDEERYNLLAWVVMPNHIHVVAQFRQEFPLSKVLHSWKSYIANKSNKLLGRSGQFWQREYFDRYIRNEDHMHNATVYVEYNPVKSGLVGTIQDWPWSSAGFRAKEAS